jgi:exopolysaccharide biosynthesis predicted pyruvyltransferase EpsI
MISGSGIETPSAAAQSTVQATGALPTNGNPLRRASAQEPATQRKIGAEALAAHLQGVIHGVLRQVLPAGPLCLVDYPNHSNVGDSFTLLVRDHVSFEFARSYFDCQIYLCPDMAFCLGVAHRRPPIADLLCLLRTDKERKCTFHIPNHASTIVTDWLGETRSERRGAKLHALVRAVLTCGGRTARRHARYNAFALRRYRRGVRVLSQGRIVISDRLHAHIIQRCWIFRMSCSTIRTAS